MTTSTVYAALDLGNKDIMIPNLSTLHSPGDKGENEKNREQIIMEGIPPSRGCCGRLTDHLQPYFITG